MVFTDDTGDALVAAVALANSALDPDTMTTLEEANAFYDEHGYTGARPRTRADLDALRALRGTLRELLTAERDEAVPLVNDILAEHRALPQLLRHDGLDWHLHAVAGDAPFATRIAVERWRERPSSGASTRALGAAEPLPNGVMILLPPAEPRAVLRSAMRSRRTGGRAR